MDSNKKQPTKGKFENTLDSIGMWFTAVALFAILVAGIIVYHIANNDIRTASNEAMSPSVSSVR
jgi:cytochrome b subunit of formate dehydrogenase